MLKKIRKTLAVICFIAVILLFLDFTGTLHHWLGWMAKVQFVPAILAFNVVIIVALALITLVFGRIYCSVICPLGVMQDIISWFHRKKNRFSYSREMRWLRYPVLVIFIVALVAGIGSLFALLEPYGTFGIIATNLLQPVYECCNNMIASITENCNNYSVYSVEVWMKGAASLVTAIVLLLIIGYLAWRSGRTYCNTICPVGTFLGLISRFSLLKIHIDNDKCIKCGMCTRNCKASCVNHEDGTIDHSRCVVCGNCQGQCKFDAMHFSAPLTPVQTESTAPETPSPKGNAGESRRAALTSIALLAGAALAKAQTKVEPKTTDGGLADLVAKEKSKRDKLITPPGSLSIRNLRSHCTACQLCIDACPNDVLRPSKSLDRFMQPEVSFEHGYCRPECTRCSEVCPTSAIRPITKEARTAIQVGHAVWTRELCIPVRDEKPCGLCSRKCPAGAIQMVPLQAGVHQDGWRWRDADNQEIPREKVLLIPVVNEEKCIGCGACENLCPSNPLSAIHVEGHEVHREI